MAENTRRDPKAALNSAIFTLSQFASEEKNVIYPTFTVNDGKLIPNGTSSFQKIYDTLSATLSRKARERLTYRKKQVQKVVLNAIGTVKRNHLFIAKMQMGNQSERELAETALITIKQYNLALIDRKKRMGKFRLAFTRFFYQLFGWSFDEENFISQIDLPSNHLLEVVPNLESIENMNSVPLLTQEADSIRMKASMLLKQHGIQFKSFSEAVNTIKTSSIHAIVDPGTSTSTISLTVDVLPGTTIKVSGSFKRDKGYVECVPIADSFQLAVTSAHNGFPHPSQNSGWSFCDALIPSYPHNLESLPYFSKLYSMKKSIALALLPNGNLLEKAKEMHNQKCEIFQKQKKLFLQKHQELSLAILKASSTMHNRSIVTEFFNSLQDNENVFEHLSKIWKHINNYFILRPHNYLQKAWIDQENVLFSNDPEEIRKGAQKLLEDECAHSTESINKVLKISMDLEEKKKCQFIGLMGTILAKESLSIILQHWSETLQCSVPQFSELGKKIQLSTYIQLKTFLDSFEETLNSEKEILDSFCKKMEEDIVLFEAPSFLTIQNPQKAIFEELKSYYQMRHEAALEELKG